MSSFLCVLCVIILFSDVCWILFCIWTVLCVKHGYGRECFVVFVV